MAEKRQYAFASPELHWLNNPLGSSHGHMRNELVRNLLSISANNRDNENHQLVDHGNSSKPSPHLPKSHGKSPNGKDATKHNDFLVTLASVTAVAPIERVYILMQCQNEMIKAGRLSTPYKGMEDCFRRTIKHEGVLSLWRGNSLNVLKHCHKNIFTFLMVKLPYWNYMDKKTDESPMWVLPFLLVPFYLSSYPLDYARVRLATDVKSAAPLKFSLDVSRNVIGKRQFNDRSDVYKKTLQLDGLPGLYRGISVACIGHFAHFMTNSFDPASRNEKHNQKKPTLLAVMLFTLTVPVLFYPCITVSRRMMMTSGEARRYGGVLDAFYQIVKTEGVSSLFKGATPYMIHSIAQFLAQFGFVYMTFSMLQTPAK
ncbi:ADP,ATP carrier protein 1, mitochondrial-like [Silene latifolia]|uniref:ADP,ATP carrier protein 1, mitochondrial-like n=1 Tax=Silene latifolia TaxID=37657 RepID=UPI003D77E1F7